MRSQHEVRAGLGRVHYTGQSNANPRANAHLFLESIRIVTMNKVLKREEVEWVLTTSTSQTECVRSLTYGWGFYLPIGVLHTSLRATGH